MIVAMCGHHLESKSNAKSVRMSMIANFATQPLPAYFRAHTHFLAAKFNQLASTISYRSLLPISAHPLHCCHFSHTTWHGSWHSHQLLMQQ